MIVFLAQVALSQVPVAAPPAPPLVQPRAMTILRAPQNMPAQGPVVPYSIEVEARAGDQLLWSGTLMVARGMGATFRRDLSQASAVQCDQQDGRYRGNRQDSFSVQLSPAYGDDPNRIGVEVRWSRPGEDNCQSGTTKRSIEMSSQLLLPPGGSVEARGDGGLIVRLRRR